jgi:hypothetical protein
MMTDGYSHQLILFEASWELALPRRKRRVWRITALGAPSTPWQMWNQAKGFATLTRRSRTGRDREDESGPGIVSLETTEKAVTMASTDVAVTRWRLPLVPRETDELPSPTDRKSLWIFIQHGCSAFLAEGASRSEPVLPPLTLHFNVAQPSQVGCSERLRANQTESKVMYDQVTRSNTIFTWLI